MEEQHLPPAAARAPVARREIFCLGIVRDTGSDKGRGVYAPRAIAAGELVEVCPVLFLPAPFSALPVAIQRATFAWGVLARTSPTYVIALGYGGIYNHANPANLRYAADVEAKTLVFTASEHIASGAEMTINFNCLDGGTRSSEDSWFEAVGLQPLR